MRKLFPCLLATTLGLASVTSAQSPHKPIDPPVDPVVGQLVDGHNKERAKEGLPPLKLEPRLVEAANAHARDMADREKMSHDGSNGSSPQRRIVDAGYHYLRAGENVAVGYQGVEGVMEGWMDSPGHKKNILGDFTEIGVARVVGKDDKPYWCADFGTPMPKFDPATASKDLAARINEERVAAKIPVLTVDEKLAKAAQGQAASLAKKKGQAGVTASFDGIDQKLYADLALSVANGHPDAPTMLKVILEQPDLKAQILGKYSRIGTGYATADDGVPFWCLILGNPARK